MRPQPAVPRSYPWVFAALYLGVLSAGAYYDLAGLCAGGFSLGRLGRLAGALVLPLALEVFEHRRRPVRESWPAAAARLAARMLLYEIVVGFDCSGFSKFLYLVVPFEAYFLHPAASLGLAVFYVGVFVARLWPYSPAWYLNQEYVSDLLIFAIGLVFAMAMAAAVAAESASRRRAERLLSDLEVSHERLKAYAEQAARLAAAEERNRLARDIHDSLGHYLTVIAVQLEKALAFRERDPGQADEAVQASRRAAREALQDVRRSVGALYGAPEAFSLAPALTDLVRRAQGESLAVELRIEGDESAFSKLVLMSLYRVAQEGLTNIQKHSQASQAQVRVAFGEHEASLLVGDNGRGFAMPAQGRDRRESNGHFGLQGMRERIELVGGSMAVESSPARGTSLRVRIPRQRPGLTGEPAPGARAS